MCAQSGGKGATMTRDELVAITDARVKLKELVEEVLPQRNVVLLRHNKVVGIMVDPQRYNALIDEIEDLEDEISILEARLNPDDRTPLEDFEAELAGEPAAKVG